MAQIAFFIKFFRRYNMKKMKRILALTMALVMVMALAACGGKDEPAPDTTTPDEPTETTQEIMRAVLGADQSFVFELNTDGAPRNGMAQVRRRKR